MNVFSSGSIPVEPVSEGVSRRVLAWQDELMLVEVRFKKGAIGAVHSHPHRQIGYVKEGEFEFELDGAKTRIRAGDSYVTEPGREHGVVALTDGVLLDFFTPARKDFL